MSLNPQKEDSIEAEKSAYVLPDGNILEVRRFLYLSFYMMPHFARFLVRGLARTKTSNYPARMKKATGRLKIQLSGFVVQYLTKI